MKKVLRLSVLTLTFCILMLNLTLTANAASGDLKISVSGTEVSGATVAPGSVLTFSVELENTTDVAINNIKVSVSQDPYWNQTVSLAGKEKKSVTYSYSLKPSDSGGTILDFRFSASNGTGTSSSAVETFSGSSRISYTVASASSAEFSAVASTTNSFPMKIGVAVKYDLTVKNTGNMTIRDAVIKSAIDQKIVVNLQAIQPGETVTETVSYIIPSSTIAGELSHPFIFTAPGIETKSATVTSSVVGNKGISVKTSVSNPNPKAGEKVTATVTVTNTGDIPFKNLKVTNPLDPSWGTVIPLLASNAAISEKFTYTVPYDAPSGGNLNFEFVVTEEDGSLVPGTVYEDPPRVIVSDPGTPANEQLNQNQGNTTNNQNQEDINNQGTQGGYNTLPGLEDDTVVGDTSSIPDDGRTLDGAPQLGPAGSDLPTNGGTSIGGTDLTSTTDLSSGKESSILPKMADPTMMFAWLPLVAVLAVLLSLRALKYKRDAKKG